MLTNTNNIYRKMLYGTNMSKSPAVKSVDNNSLKPSYQKNMTQGNEGQSNSSPAQYPTYSQYINELNTQYMQNQQDAEKNREITLKRSGYTAENSGANPLPMAENNAPSMPSYMEDYFNKQQEALKNQYDYLNDQALKGYQDAQKQADENFYKGQSTYATTAEELRRAGLQGGGYGDFINAVASQNRQEAISEAQQNYEDVKRQNQINYDTSIANLEKDKASYLEGIKQEEEAKAEADKNTSDTIYNGALNDIMNNFANIDPNTYFDNLVKMGLDESRKQELIDAYNKQKDSNEVSGIISSVATGGLSDKELSKYDETIKKMYDEGKISDSKYSEYKKAYADNIFTEVENIISDGGEITETTEKYYYDKVKDMLDNGYITQEEYNAFFKDIEEKSVNMTTSDYGAKRDMQNELDDYYSQGRLSKADYDELTKKLGFNNTGVEYKPRKGGSEKATYALFDNKGGNTDYSKPLKDYGGLSGWHDVLTLEIYNNGNTETLKLYTQNASSKERELANNAGIQVGEIIEVDGTFVTKGSDGKIYSLWTNRTMGKGGLAGRGF